MSQSYKALVVFALTAFGLWGCAKGSSVSADRGKTEARIAKLETELRTAAAMRDQMNAKLVDFESRLTAADERNIAVEKERDRLSKELNAATLEKTAMASSYDDLISKLDAVVSQAKVAQVNRKSNVTATPVSNNRKAVEGSGS